jgi:hypothetical protein
MYDRGDTENNSKSFKTLAIAFAGVFIVLLAAVGISRLPGKAERNSSDKTASAEVLKQEFATISTNNLLGEYLIKVQSDGSETSFIGYIDTDALGQYNLHVLSEFAPRTYLLKIASDGQLSNDELGIGTMTYKESIDKTTIQFDKDGSRCILIK